MPRATADLRRENLAAVLGHLRAHGPTTRAGLAISTGLAKATVSAVVADLLEVAAVVEGEPVTGRRGRPSQLVALAPHSHIGWGFEVNVERVSGVAIDLSGTVLGTSWVPVTGSREDHLAEVLSHLAPRTGIVAGATIALPGLVRGDGRTVAWAPNLPTRDAELADALRNLLPGTDVTVRNDADCSALAEVRQGHASDVSHGVFLTGTVGLGAGLINEGAVTSGAHGFAGEVGHLPIGDPSSPCGCGRSGCWEAQVGLAAVLGRVGIPSTGDPVEDGVRLAELASEDGSVRRHLGRLGDDLGRGIGLLSNILDLQCVILGGYFAPVFPWLRDAADAAVAESLASPSQPPPKLVPSELGSQVAALGAAEVSLTRVVSGHLLR